MAIIRFPNSREELHRSVFKLFGMNVRVLVDLKFSASSSTNKVCLFYHCLGISPLSIYPTDCFTDIDASPELRTVQDPVFLKVQKNYARFKIWWNGDDSGDIKHDSKLNDI